VLVDKSAFESSDMYIFLTRSQRNFAFSQINLLDEGEAV
jgi:hypothetical protein